MNSPMNGSMGSVIWFGVLTAINIGILVAFFTVGSLEEIGKNWPRYRCNPLFMPFAGSFGSDPVENFHFCLDSIFAGKAAIIFGPLYAILNDFGSIISKIVNVAMGLRLLFANMLHSVQDFLSNVKQRIKSILTQIRISFMKMNQLMGRVFGTLYAVIYMGLSGLAAGQNIANNDLVKFLLEFCFHPDTPVQVADTTFVPIHDIVVGEYLAKVNGITPLVTSKFIFDGTHTPMVTIGTDELIHLSAEHYVEGALAEEHPTAKPASSISRLICLNVEHHEFYVGAESKFLVSDYDESSDPVVVKKTQELAERLLNGCASHNVDSDVVANALKEYSLGIDDAALVLLEDGTWKPIQAIQIGDILQVGGRVTGTVEEMVTSVVETPQKLLLSASQLLWTGTKWDRAAVVYPDKLISMRTTLRQLFTEHCSSFTIRHKYREEALQVREYREVADPAMETLYRISL